MTSADPPTADLMPRDWNEEYKTGTHRREWDHALPSPELVGFMFSFSPRARLKVLDVGCGSGTDAVFLAQLGHEAYGLDLSEEALRLAAEKAMAREVTLSLHCGDALRTDFADAAFDLVSDRGCFHHIHGQDRKIYGQEMARIMKPNSRLLLRGAAISNRDQGFSPINRRALDFSFDSRAFKIERMENIWYATDAIKSPIRFAVLRRMR